MHSTTSTRISGSLDALFELKGRLDNPFLPSEELIGMIIAGIVLIDSLISNTDIAMFGDDEVEFVTQLNNQLGVELKRLHDENEIQEF